jgi:hypothetical protein
MGRMCTDRDCDIFRGKLIACDACERMNETVSVRPRMSGPPAAGRPNPPRMS